MRLRLLCRPSDKDACVCVCVFSCACKKDRQEREGERGTSSHRQAAIAREMEIFKLTFFSELPFFGRIESRKFECIIRRESDRVTVAAYQKKKRAEE